MLTVYLKAFQVGQQLLSLGGGGNDTSSLEIVASLQRIEGALEEVIFNLREQNILIENEYERNLAKDTQSDADRVSGLYSDLIESITGTGRLSSRDVKAILGSVKALSIEHETLVRNLESSLSFAKKSPAPLESFIVPLTVASVLGQRITEIALMPSLLIDLINMRDFRTKHTIDYLEAEAIHLSKMRLIRLARILGGLPSAFALYRQRWLTEALQVTPHASLKKDEVAKMTLRVIGTRRHDYYSRPTNISAAGGRHTWLTLLPSVVMRIEWVVDIYVSREGAMTVIPEPEKLSFHHYKSHVQAIKDLPLLERDAPGRSIRMKKISSVVPPSSGAIGGLAEKNPLGLRLHREPLLVAYKLYSQLERDRSVMAASKISGFYPRHEVTWRQLIDSARSHSQKLAFVIQGSKFLSDRRDEIALRVAAIQGGEDA